MAGTMKFNWLTQRSLDRADFPASGQAPDLTGRHHLWRQAKLLETIEWAAANSPFYQERLSPHAVKTLKEAISDLKAEELWRALASLPLTRPEDLAADSLAFLAVGQDEVEGIVSVSTSGTSGRTKRIFSTVGDMAETIVFFEYGMRILVAPGRDRVALAMSPARPGNVGDLLGRALERWRIPFTSVGFVPANEGGENRWLEDLAAWRPTCLVGVPPQMLALSRHEKAPLLKDLRSMLLSGDVAEGRLVEELEKNFPACRVYRHYGLTECGLGGAVECEQRDWPHLRDDLWVEIIGPDGRPLPPGTDGEIVITPLTRRGQPLLRYRTGDEGLIMPEACTCGTLSPRLKIYGRLNDRVFHQGPLTLRTADFEAPLLKLNFVRDYDLVLGADGGLEIIISPAGEPPPQAEELATAQVNEWLSSNGAALSCQVSIARPAGQKKSPSRASGGKRRLIRQKI